MTFGATSVRVDVPATSANLGPGFDTAGLALGLYDTVTIEALPSGRVEIEIHGEGKDYLPRDERHLIVKALRVAAQAFDLPEFGLKMVAHNRIAQSRGMGSSASAIVAGVSAAAGLAGLDTDSVQVRDEIFNIAARLEGHPDNVAPAVYGGLTMSWELKEDEVPTHDALLSRLARAPHTADSLDRIARPAKDGYPTDAEPFAFGYHTVSYPVASNINAWVFIPDYHLSTQKAREALPAEVPYRDALKNVSRVALLPAALGRADGNPQANAILFSATADTLHQPYRASLMQPSYDLVEFLRMHKYAATISGAGPCVLVLHAGDETASLTNIASPWLTNGHWRMEHLSIDTQGVRIQTS